MSISLSTSSALVDPLDALLGYHLRRTTTAATAALTDLLAPLGVNPGEATLLLFLGANPGCTQSDIGRALRAQPANLVPLINKLALLGIVAKQPGKGRAITLTLTAQGESLHAQVAQAFARHEAMIARSIPADRREELLALLRAICRDACHPD
ncbi:MAG: MarR family winged helix-turn-helix transcriptional regulator [Pseudomonadota bacterium]